MKTVSAATLAWLGAAGAAAMLGFWGGLQFAANGGGDFEDVTTRLDRLELRLEAIALAVSSTAARPPVPPPSASGGPTTVAAAPPRWTAPRSVSSEEIAQERGARKVALEAGFAAEPLDSDWAAAAQSRLLQAALSDVAVQSGVAPASFDARCRSKSCRIVARFEPGADGAGWADHYILGATGMLSRAETLVELLPDGGTEVVIFGSGD